MVTHKRTLLSEDDKRVIEQMVAAIVTRNMAAIRSFPKSEVYREDAFVENLDYARVGLDDMPEDIFADVFVGFDPELEFDLICIKLRDHGRTKSRVQLFVQRDKSDGTLRLNSIGDIEPEDEWAN